MRITVISPESIDARERPAMEGFFAEGLETYHVRKPGWSSAALEEWLVDLPKAWRPKMVLHHHVHLVETLGLGGAHERDTGKESATTSFSRSCHNLDILQNCVGRYTTLLFGPVFPSITKKGYGPAQDFPWERLSDLLASRKADSATSIFAIGGVDEHRLARCRDLGFDGAAVMGAVWNMSDPLRAFSALHRTAIKLEVARHAA
jgi:thiamine-phosphate pyrophosphorylase